MKNIILTLGIILISISGICQEFLQKNESNPEIHQQQKQEIYVIGIGNELASTYWDVLRFLENSPYLKVIASYQMHQIIAVKIADEEFKSYDEYYNYLKLEFDDLQIWRKDMSIFTKDCQDEYLKEKN